MSHAAVTSYAMPAMAAARADLETTIVAMTDHGNAYDYPSAVRFQSNDDKIKDYVRAADFLNAGQFEVVSLYGELLKYGHPQWVRDLGRGAASAGGGLLLVLASVLIGETIAGTAGRWLGPIAGMVGAILLVRGAWLLAAADPAEQVGVGPATARLAVRLAPCAGVLSFGWFKLSNLIVPMRVSRETEVQGADIPEMGALAYPDFELKTTQSVSDVAVMSSK